MSSSHIPQYIMGKLCSLGIRFLFLQLLLWSTFLQPSIDVEFEWVPTLFFFSTKSSKCIIRLHRKPMDIFESSFFASIALLGYHGNYISDVGTKAVGVYASTLATFEESMMGVRQKYYWMSFVPWIITFAHNWLQNVGVFLMLLTTETVYEANDVFSAILMLMSTFVVQALLASEIVILALQGWKTMHHINDENLLLEHRRRMFLTAKI